ncbi:heterokaryon incompatibility protein-domain-containing protein [Coniochaeta sp. 2T2.1]|nr:heterokaryon incompatibility protein-domain-containing protein [Coniochaeta sp. 2T2.1]
MRLLNVRTLKLEEHFDVSIPHYSILSHTWGAQEVVYSHIRQDGYKAGSSSKVDGCIAQAIKDGLDYVWIDTCCIDKSSSAELSEAINSIFAWYWGCVVCYACLVDVPDDVEEWDVDNDEDGADINSAFAKSRWFTRGWTLQELLAPDNVVFFSVGWLPIGRKLESAAQKMSWAAGRKTTRREDRAYSLLGIFGVNMPMLYGEGDSAFARLQEEILRVSDDESLLAWGYGLPPPGDSRLLARTTDEFSACGHVCRFGLSPQHYTMTNKGLQISWLISDVLQPQSCSLALLHCGVLKADNGGMAYEYIGDPAA